MKKRKITWVKINQETAVNRWNKNYTPDFYYSNQREIIKIWKKRQILVKRRLKEENKRGAR